ncbi:MAG: UDP-N-acetylmuramoyl-L-alanyl-D-glutamate--2,6-diaminopimelate ligase [Candidatus Nealsonbacteria bacterium]|nr:UDP-N-acetylmuramoyl-L-alanyl-D-glutamate--2,6-diaminopimelate ligase [Candidatus Nealsonbacteria bacterium]
MKNLIKKFIPAFLLDFYHLSMVFSGALLYGFPGKNKGIKVIGVTGTSGKSTTVDLISRVLENAGYKVASLSTVRFKINEKEWENKLKMTMPGRMKIQKFLRKALNNKCEFVVMEVSSEGIRQNRHKFIDFDCAVFTNLSPEHIESHGSFEKYKGEKLKLFKTAKNIHVINGDDKNADDFLNTGAKRKIVFGMKNSGEILARSISLKPNGTSFSVENTAFNLNLLGEFNIYNALAAIAVSGAYGIDLKTCRKALESAKGISGRMEIVLKDPFTIIVDYAHTPDQLESAYKALSGSNLICVLGSCGGGRDKWKRPIMGKVADKYCSRIIITNEDPYDEDPLSIINQVAKGIKAEKILDRKEAIRDAIKSAKPKDTVIITGKGSEPWMCVKNNKKIPWSDKNIAKEAADLLLGIK